MFLISGVVTYILFFVLLPGISAVITRARWRKFRQSIIRSAEFQELNYNNCEIGNRYRFYGKLESFVNDNTVWLKGETLSISIDLTKISIFRLYKGDYKVDRTPWSSLSSIVEGADFFVTGVLEYVNGSPCLVSGDETPLNVVICDGQKKVVEELIIKARDKNELWNSYTPYLYITGVFILIILSYFAYKSSYDKTDSFYLLVAAGTPFYFILPPGLLFYLIYRSIWERSIRLSILGELSLLKGKKSRFERFGRKSKIRERASLILYLLGYLTNIIIAGFILLRMYQLLIYS